MLGRGLSRTFSGTPPTLTIAESLPLDDAAFTSLLGDHSATKELTIAWPACEKFGKAERMFLRLELGKLDVFGLPTGEEMVLSLVSGMLAIQLFLLTISFLLIYTVATCATENGSLLLPYDRMTVCT